MQRPTRLANLRDDLAFPTWRKVPGEDHRNLDYYCSDEDYAFNPDRHWCLLGEITGAMTFTRLSLTLKDKNSQPFSLHFYTDNRGLGTDEKLLENGNTVAIMYPHKHAFLDGSVGIRQEDMKTLKFIPFSMDELLAMSDRLHATIKDGKPSCHACGKQPNELLKCSRCGMFSYCNKECQVDGWEKKGHKRDCKILKDQDIQRLFTAIDFDDWDYDAVQFPIKLYEERKMRR